MANSTKLVIARIDRERIELGRKGKKGTFWLTRGELKHLVDTVRHHDKEAPDGR